MNPLILFGILLAAALIFAIVSFLMKSSVYKKGSYAKQVVGKELKKFASVRKMTVLSDVSVQDGNETARFDHVLIGYFGVLFIQSIQGKGSFYGDGHEKIWSFSNNESKEKITFKNPVAEMNEKIEIFRRVLADKKIYNVPVESAIAVIGFNDEPKLYLSNISDNENILVEKMIAPFLKKEYFETDNQVDPEAIKALFQK